MNTQADKTMAQITIDPPPQAHLYTTDSSREQSSRASLSEKEPAETEPENAATRQESHQTQAPDAEDEERPAELTRTQSSVTYPSRKKVAPIMAAVYLSMFLVMLDRTIVGVALPVLSNQFHSFQDIGWYGSAYLMTTCAFQLFMGKIYSFYNVKWVFLSCITLFEIGSLIDATAPNSDAFIWGRAIQGLGAAGVQNGAVSIMITVTPLKDRPLWMGMVGLVVGVSSVLGPIVGGAFTTDVSWRWCFYINLPIGGIAMVVIFFLLKGETFVKKAPTWQEQVKKLDPIGLVLFVGAIVSLLLALQWGGVKYAWGDAQVFACLIVSGTLFILWFADQVKQKENATLPLRFFKHRTICAAFWMTLMIGSSMLTMTIWLPTWFQAIKGASAAHAGVMNIPMVLSLVVASIMTGALVKKIGYYTPFAIACSVVATCGAGLFQLFTPSTNHSLWIGAQFLYGFGLGLGLQQGSLAVQTTLPRKDVNIGVSLIFFAQTFGGAIFVSVGQNVLNNQLSKSLAQIPFINPDVFQSSGATEFQSMIPEQYRSQAINAYNDALVSVFAISVATAAASILGSALLPWKSTKGKGPGGPEGPNPEPKPAEESSEKV